LLRSIDPAQAIAAWSARLDGIRQSDRAQTRRQARRPRRSRAVSRQSVLDQDKAAKSAFPGAMTNTNGCGDHSAESEILIEQASHSAQE
jgi:hypothetical protein